MSVKVIAGVKVDTKTNIVVDDTVPVSERFYHSSRLPENISCYDFHLKQYKNVELFQPVIYDLDNPMPKYNPAWEVYDNDTKKKKLIRINYPQSYLRWWYEQRKRCLEGYTVGNVHISGLNYWYLNFWRIKLKGKGQGLHPPMFIDLDKEFFDLLEKAKAEDKNLLCLKRRQIGFTEKLSAIIAHEVLMYPSAQTLIVAGLEDYSMNAFKKTQMGIDALSDKSQEKAGREFFKRKIYDQEAYIQFGYAVEGIMNGYLSEIFAVTTKDNPQAASGKSPTFVFMEEAGINPLLKRVYNMILPSIQERGKQNGRCVVIVGTGGEMKKGVADLMEMFYAPEKYNLLAVPNTYEGEKLEGQVCCPFFPAWKYHIMDNDGNSYKEAGIADLMDKRARLKNDKNKLYDEKTQMPLTPREAFSVSGLSPFNSVKLEKQRDFLLANSWPDKVQYGRFEAIREGKKVVGAKWVPAPGGQEDITDADGDFMYPAMIIEHPDRPNEIDMQGYEYRIGMSRYLGLYGAGTDSYDKDSAETSDSLGSFCMMKGYRSANATSMMHVCRITYRPSKKEKFYEQTALACIYYGEAENLIEYSNIAIMDWYKANDYEHLLKERPEVAYANIKDSKVNNRFGIDPNTKSVWIEHYASYIEDYADNIYDLEMVQKHLSFRNHKEHNDDITISAMLAYENIYDDLKKIELQEDKPKRKGPWLGYSKQNGKLTRI